MNKLTCIIVDDEPVARDLLVTYCSYLSNLEIIAVCGNALSAREVMANKKVDLLFLDIDMPVLDGISLLKTLNYMPQVIFTTAYTEHAVTAFEMAACDYLVKPFPLERFIKAVDKANMHTAVSLIPTQVNPSHILIKAENKLYQLRSDEILFAEASGNYSKIVLFKETIKPNISFTALEEQLSKKHFLRVHRSFIINQEKVDYIEGNRIFIGTFEILIGNSYKEKVAIAFSQNSDRTIFYTLP
ncbi:LytTR family DNA-binding domain-containing protein [Mucilaginibacter koreensis]